VLTSLLGSRDEKGQALDTETIVDELHLMFFAGHDTTVTVIANALIHLAMCPEVLTRARAEQEALGQGPMDREPIGRTEWLTQTLNESIRLISPISSAFRVTTEPTTCGEFSIPAGWTVVFNRIGVLFGAQHRFGAGARRTKRGVEHSNHSQRTRIGIDDTHSKRPRGDSWRRRTDCASHAASHAGRR
jgi:hypothetical protein